jgi:hypothetical protein
VASWGKRILAIKTAAPTPPKTARTSQGLTVCLWLNPPVAIVGTELSDGLEYWDVATGLMEPVLRTVGGGCTGGSVGTQIAVGDSSIEPVLLAVDGGSLGGSVGTRMAVG